MHSVLRTRLWHQRTLPAKHQFEYDLALVLLDLQSLDQGLFPIGLGTQGLKMLKVSLKDYLLPYQGQTWLQTMQKALETQGIQTQIQQAFVLTLPRFFGYAFNPVSFFLIHGVDDRAWVLMEVANTFGEKHPYLCEAIVQNGMWSCHAQIDKVFFVSPFNQVEGRYDFKLSLENAQIHIEYMLYNPKDECVFKAGFKGSVHPWSLGVLMGTMMRMPLSWLGTSLRILAHAFRLYFRRGLAYVDLPRAQAGTWKAGPGMWLQRVLTGAWLVRLQHSLQNFKQSRS